MRFSIVVCSYNPSEQLLIRCLAGCTKLLEKHPDSELIIVDNNSSPPLASRQIAETLIKSSKRIRIVPEPKQGLSFARISGLREAQGEVLVFADDDNVLATDYLFALENLRRDHPQVAVWGPGEVRAEFQGKEKRWIRRHFSYLFQEKHQEETQFGTEKGWPSFYPAGSGMCVERSVMEQYAREVEAGRLNATGRKGKELSSGEDAQLVWTAVKMGLNAGTSPSLKLVHLIPASRQTLGYLQKLQRQIACSHSRAFVEMFPEHSEQVKPLSAVGYAKLALTMLVRSKFAPLRWYREFSIKLAWFRGIRDAQRG